MPGPGRVAGQGGARLDLKVRKVLAQAGVAAAAEADVGVGLRLLLLPRRLKALRLVLVRVLEHGGQPVREGRRRHHDVPLHPAPRPPMEICL